MAGSGTGVEVGVVGSGPGPRDIGLGGITRGGSEVVAGTEGVPTAGGVDGANGIKVARFGQLRALVERIVGR